jgi:two-component system NtrC family sensor kinase
MKKILIFIVIMFLNCNSYKDIYPDNGILDLEEIDFEKQEIIKLNGNWNYFSEKFIYQKDLYLNSPVNPDGLISVPGFWNTFRETEKNSPVGIGTYLLSINLPSPGEYSLFTKYFNTSFEIEVNGKLVYKGGKIGSVREETVPYHSGTHINLGNITNKRLDILIRVSNFHNQRGGLTETIYFGKSSSVEKLRDLDLAKDLFFFGALLITALYHFFLYIYKKSDKYNLYFSLLCFIFSIRPIVQGQTFILKIFEFINYNSLIKFEYLSIILGSIFANLYIKNLFNLKFNKFFKNIFYSLLIISISSILFLDSLVFTNFTFIYQFICILFSLEAYYYLVFEVNKNNDVRNKILISSSIIIICILNDILNYNNIIHTARVIHFAIFIFILFQAIILAQKNSKTVKEIETTKETIEEFAKTLENKVTDRTKKLEQMHFELSLQKVELENLNLLSKDLNENLEINSILNKFQKYIQFKYNIKYFIFYDLDSKNEYLIPKYLFLPEMINDASRDEIKKLNIPINLGDGMHLASLKNKKVFWLRKLNRKSKLSEENKLVELLKTNSIIFVPLVLNRIPIAIIDFFSFDKFKLNKSDLLHLSIIAEQIAGIINNSILIQKSEEAKKELELLKEKAENTLIDLKKSQNNLIQSEKMAALGQMVAGVAHEINTPIGAIKASAGNINVSLDEIIKNAPDIIRNLEPNIMKIVENLIGEVGITQNSISTKDERKIRKQMMAELESEGISRSSEISDTMISLKITDLPAKYNILWRHPRVSDILKLIYNLAGLRLKTKMIETAVDKTAKIVYALKNYIHRDSSGKMILSNIPNGIETVLTIYENYTKHGIEIIKDFEKKLPEVYCFPDELNQVWTNLIHNSIQAMGGIGKIRITVKSLVENEKKGMLVEIEDNGPGIPEEIQDKIFEPLFTTKKAGEGTGLGLHICKQIMEKQNGSIDVESIPGRTTFRIKFGFSQA